MSHNNSNSSYNNYYNNKNTTELNNKQSYQQQHPSTTLKKEETNFDQYINFGTPKGQLQSPATLQPSGFTPTSHSQNQNNFAGYSSPTVNNNLGSNYQQNLYSHIQDIHAPPSTTTNDTFNSTSGQFTPSLPGYNVQAGLFSYGPVPVPNAGGISGDTPPPAPTTAQPMNFNNTFSPTAAVMQQGRSDETVYPSSYGGNMRPPIGFNQALSQRSQQQQHQQLAVNSNNAVFLDDFSTLNSPIYGGQYAFVLTPPPNQTMPNSATSTAATANSNDNITLSIISAPPPPMIISPPAVESQQQINQSYIDTLDFSAPSFQHLQVSPSNHHNSDLLSEYSSAAASPYFPAQSPGPASTTGGNFDEDYSNHSNSKQNLALLSGVDMTSNQLDLDQLTTEFNRLTKENLNFNRITPQEITISIQAPPQDQNQTAEAAVDRTPSLFSNSSNRSSPNNSPYRSRANSTDSPTAGAIKAGHYANQLLSPNVNSSPFIADESPTTATAATDFLRLPDPNLDPEHQEMRRGRQRRQSSSRTSTSHSRSRSKSDQQQNSDRSLSANREKMLELASPNQTNKRTQKHPSLYSCHLCEKRFTRPYNLKSHLRTHTDERPFVCTVCGKAFARQHDRKRHEDLHTGNKKFECFGFLRDGVTQWGCRKRFARTDALGRHFKTEAGKICIKPLVLEHEREIEEKKKNDNSGLDDSGGELYGFKDGLPESLFEQFPNLLGGSSGPDGDL